MICNRMGSDPSKPEQDSDALYGPINARYFGLVNFGNTCYCNSVLQALYFCRSFREKVLQYKYEQKNNRKETLLTCLSDLFSQITTQKKKTGHIAPKKFIQRLKRENEAFDNFMQQDAHEFLNYLLNTIADLLQAEQKAERSQQVSFDSGVSSLHPTKPNKKNLSTSSTTAGGGVNVHSTANSMSSSHARSNNASGSPSADDTSHASSNELPCGSSTKSDPTWVHEIFQGTLTNETRCLNCETVSSKDEDFLDLSIDIEQNKSINYCLQGFSNTETLLGEHKYYCEVCCSKQEAQKRMRIKSLPQVLALHLKRFKYQEHLNRFTKLSYRVVFPFELRLFNTSDDAQNADRLYDLVAVVVHCGTGPNRGHYITIVRSYDHWVLFDDDIVERIEPQAIEEFYGLSDLQKNTAEAGYILFYQSREWSQRLHTRSFLTANSVNSVSGNLPDKQTKES